MNLRTLPTLIPGLLLAAAIGCAHAAEAPARPAVPPETYRQFAMQHDGNPGRGQALFADEQRLGCTRCHSTDGTGQKPGPDLFSAGDQFARSDLVTAVLQPSATIAVGYETAVIETKSGEEHTGILKQSTPEWIELAGADAQRLRINRPDIKEQRGSRLSLMPEGLQAGLTTQEFTDLIEYLVSLKQPANSATSGRGMPEDIPLLQHPVTLRPLLPSDLHFADAGPHPTGLVQTGLVHLAQVPGQNQLFVAADQAGILWRLERTPTGFQKGIYLDLSKEVFSARGPNGLLGVAFHPRFTQNHKYYLKHQVLEEGAIHTHIVERTTKPDATTDSGSPSRLLLNIPAIAEHHNGGWLQFGPDGYLYIGMGDSAPNHDPQGHGQNLGMLLGKMLRIDVDHAEADRPYSIPKDNPFVNQPGARPEIWAWGFREPWRCSFDTATGDFWVADLGQERGDEIAIVRKGENHGWNVYQGFELFSPKYKREGVTYTRPIFSTRRKHGTAIVGGQVFRQDPASTFHGVYVFGDYGSKRIWGMTQENRELKSVRQLATAPQAITAIVPDAQGNLYAVGYQGMIYQLDFTNARFE